MLTHLLTDSLTHLLTDRSVRLGGRFNGGGWGYLGGVLAAAASIFVWQSGDWYYFAGSFRKDIAGSFYEDIEDT